MTWPDFLSMNGYEAYVWSAYALTLCVLAGEALLLVRRRRMAQRTDRREAA
jgi:heme exporter protein CcmD